MSFKVDTKGSGKSNATYEQDDGREQEKPFVRDTSDNKIFPEIQIKDISKYIDENTVGKMDSDNMIYRACSNMETKYIEVQHNTEDVYIELKGIREFKGQTKLISSVSWLGVENEKRKIKKLPEWEVKDFTITPKSKLIMEYSKALEQAKIQVHKQLKDIRLQFGVPKIDMLLGEGGTFRNKLPLCKPYKGNRTEMLRPILLKDLRKWAVDEMGAEMAVPRVDGEMVECDDLCEYWASIGFQHYRKTGVFSYVCISSDKDSLGNPKYYINPDKHSGKDNPLRGEFKYPQAMLIEATDKGCGGIDLLSGSTKKEIKGYGLKWIVYQAILGEDSADFYSAIKHLGRKFSYGEVSAYEDLLPLKTPKEVLQKAVDVMAELLPYGVQYTDHTGKEWDVPTLEYCNTYFAVAYMLRSPTDTMTFTKLCNAFGVDTSAIVGNNTMTEPKLTFNKETAEENLANLKMIWQNILPDLTGFKTKKKGDLVEIIETIVENNGKLGEQFDSFYKMKSEPKDVKKVVAAKNDLTSRGD